MPAQTLHVARAELAELTCEDAVGGCQAAEFGAGRHLTAGGQFVVIQLLTNISWLLVCRIWKKRKDSSDE